MGIRIALALAFFPLVYILPAGSSDRLAQKRLDAIGINSVLPAANDESGRRGARGSDVETADAGSAPAGQARTDQRGYEKAATDKANRDKSAPDKAAPDRAT